MYISKKISIFSLNNLHTSQTQLIAGLNWSDFGLSVLSKYIYINNF